MKSIPTASMKILNAEIGKIAKAFETHDSVILSYAKLVPSVLIDSKNHYKAVYIDSAGTYEFEIVKKNNKFIVISDGFECSTSPDAEYIKWNFESQLALIHPKVLN
jgi:hypothetical protein